MLKSLENTKIEKISLVDNPCANNSNYKVEVFKMFPDLISVDSETKDGEKIDSTLYEEVEEGEEGEEGQGDFDDEEDEEFDEIEEGDDDEEFDEDDEDDEEDDKPKKKKKN